MPAPAANRRCFAVWKSGAVLDAPACEFPTRLAHHARTRGPPWFTRCTDGGSAEA